MFEAHINWHILYKGLFTNDVIIGLLNKQPQPAPNVINCHNLANWHTPLPSSFGISYYIQNQFPMYRVIF